MTEDEIEEIRNETFQEGYRAAIQDAKSSITERDAVFLDVPMPTLHKIAGFLDELGRLGPEDRDPIPEEAESS